MQKLIDSLGKTDRLYIFNDVTGVIGEHNLFSITGSVKMKFYAICTEDLVGEDAELKVTISGLDEPIIPITLATDIVTGVVWNKSDPTTVDLDSNIPMFVIGSSSGIILDITGSNVTAGSIFFRVEWVPVSIDGKVEVGG